MAFSLLFALLLSPVFAAEELVSFKNLPSYSSFKAVYRFTDRDYQDGRHWWDHSHLIASWSSDIVRIQSLARSGAQMTSDAFFVSPGKFSFRTTKNSTTTATNRYFITRECDVFDVQQQRTVRSATEQGNSCPYEFYPNSNWAKKSYDRALSLSTGLAHTWEFLGEFEVPFPLERLQFSDDGKVAYQVIAKMEDTLGRLVFRNGSPIFKLLNTVTLEENSRFTLQGINDANVTLRYFSRDGKHLIADMNEKSFLYSMQDGAQICSIPAGFAPQATVEITDNYIVALNSDLIVYNKRDCSLAYKLALPSNYFNSSTTNFEIAEASDRTILIIGNEWYLSETRNNSKFVAAVKNERMTISLLPLTLNDKKTYTKMEFIDQGRTMVWHQPHSSYSLVKFYKTTNVARTLTK